MATLGNILWFLFFGWWSALLYLLEGCLCCITIIGIPIGKALFQYAKLMAFPFGKTIVRETTIKGKENVSVVRRVFGTIANIIWLPFGLVNFLAMIGQIVVCAITIILIPVAVVLARSCKFLFWPIGAKVITQAEYQAILTAQVMEKRYGPYQGPDGQAGIQQQSAQTWIPQQDIPAGIAQQTGQTESVGRQIGASFQHAAAQFDPMAQSIRENAGKAVFVARQSAEKGMDSVKRLRQQEMERVSAEPSASFAELCGKAESALYGNRVMTYLMPYLEIITAALAVVFALVGVLCRAMTWGLSWDVFYRGILSGLGKGVPLFLAAGLLGMVKRNRRFVLATLIGILCVNVLGIRAFDLELLFITLPLIAFYAALTVLYYCAEIRPQMQTGQGRAWAQQPQTPQMQRPQQGGFCTQCGAPLEAQARFCAKCGAQNR